MRESAHHRLIPCLQYPLSSWKVIQKCNEVPEAHYSTRQMEHDVKNYEQESIFNLPAKYLYS